MNNNLYLTSFNEIKDNNLDKNNNNIINFDTSKINNKVNIAINETISTKLNNKKEIYNDINIIYNSNYFSTINVIFDLIKNGTLLTCPATRLKMSF